MKDKGKIIAKLVRKSRRFNKPRTTSVVAVAAFFLSLMALGNIWLMNDTLRLWSESDMQNMISDSRRQARFEFCFNNNIRPCDDTSIEAFNKRPENKETDNIFNLGP